MSEIENSISLEQKVFNALRTLQKQQKKLSVKIDKQEDDVTKVTSWEKQSHWADTILANLHEISKGMKEAVLEDVHTGELLEISLNPKCTPEKNAEILYKKSRKGKRGYEIAQEQLAESRKKMASCIALIDQVTTLRDEGMAGREEEVEQLLRSVVFPVKQGLGTKKESVKPPFRHYIIDGWDIFAGKSSTNNDELSVRFAKPSDLWFHAVGYAGSHVIIRRPKGSEYPPNKIIDFAGGISVFFSKAKHTSYAEVHMCEARFVRKPRKSPAGLVTIERYKTMRMSPVDPQKFFK